MTTEQAKILEALQIAVQMEIDGEEFYLKAGQKSSNELGKKLLKSLAAEEDIHRQKFEEIYDAIRREKAWPETDYQPDRGRRLRTIFARAIVEIGPDIKAPASEIEAIQTAMNMENKSYDFYEGQSKQATGNIEKEFYLTLAGEEREHHMILLDYFEFLKNPAGWYVQKEHPSLDGG